MSVVVTKRENGRLRVQLNTGKDSKVEQSHVEDVNITRIVQQARATGLYPTRVGNPNYGNFAYGMEFREAMERIVEAKSDFMELPADIRRRFDNDPAKLIDFIGLPENESEAISLGLLPRPADAPIEPPAASVEPESSASEVVEPGAGETTATQ